MKSIQEWFDEYAQSHKNPTNKLIHWICVPSIFFSITALLYNSYVLYEEQTATYEYRITPAHLALFLVLVFYLRLSWRMAVGMFLFSLTCLTLSAALYNAKLPLGYIAITVFVVAWIGQFIGHNIEGKKPSFFKDLQFLLIGPAWLMGFIYKRLDVKY